MMRDLNWLRNIKFQIKLLFASIKRPVQSTLRVVNKRANTRNSTWLSYKLLCGSYFVLSAFQMFTKDNLPIFPPMYRLMAGEIKQNRTNLQYAVHWQTLAGYFPTRLFLPSGFCCQWQYQRQLCVKCFTTECSLLDTVSCCCCYANLLRQLPLKWERERTFCLSSCEGWVVSRKSVALYLAS